MKNKILTINVETEDQGCKIFEYLKTKVNLSSRMIKKLHGENKILVNTRKTKLDYKLKAGDIINIEIEEKGSTDIVAQDISIDIVYEDEDIMVVNKPPYMLVHPTKNHSQDTLANGLVYYFNCKGLSIPVRLISRLDRDTSGLILIAKNSLSHSRLSLDSDNIKKLYTAVVEGIIDKNSGIIDLPIGHHPEDKIKRAIVPDGQPSVTHYKVLNRGKNFTVLELELKTGRTHQIRVHLSHLGHPIYGDGLYGGNTGLISRQALHASKLAFRHPISGKRLEFTSDLMEDIKQLLRNLKTL